MALGFGGDVVDFYERYRRGYPAVVIDALVEEFALQTDDLALDLGCGTGQLALPLAARVGAVIGMDPEPDMLARAHRIATTRGVTNACWIVGADSDLPGLAAVLGGRRVSVLTIGQALHWMNAEMLFPLAASLLRPGGGVAVLTNGRPLWLQDSGWSRALRELLETRFDTTLEQTCGSDEETQRSYADGLRRAGFETATQTFGYTEEVDLNHIVGGTLSSFSVDQLPIEAERGEFSDQVTAAISSYAPFLERVDVTVLTGRL